MTPQQRSGIDNGIWLCSTCADLIDNDELRFTDKKLSQWKICAEQLAQSELGRPVPSARELDVYKAKVLGEHVTSRPILDLVAASHEIAQRECQMLDERFSVEINKHGPRTSFTLNALQTVPCSIHIAPPFATEFSAKMENLVNHGQPLKIDAAAVTLEGSRLFDFVNDLTGVFALETHSRRGATQRLRWTDRKSGKSVAAEVVGVIVAGIRSFTFEGIAFDGLHNVKYRIPFDRTETGSKYTADVGFDFSSWISGSVLTLPYLDKVFQYVTALYEGEGVDVCLEVDGYDVMTGKFTAVSQPDWIAPFYRLLRYVSQVRDFARLLNRDIRYREISISVEDIEWVAHVWFLLFRLKMLTGAEMGPVTTSLIPSPEGVEVFRAAAKRRSPIGLRLEQEFERPLNLLGETTTLGTVSITYSKVILKSPRTFSRIQAGKSIQVSFMATDDCIAEATLVGEGVSAA